MDKYFRCFASTRYTNQVHDILINKKRKEFPQRCEAYILFATIGSDQRFLSAATKFRQEKKLRKAKKVTTGITSKNMICCNYFTANVQNRYDQM